MPDSRVPVTILTGFLGAGKTTLLNRILTENHGQRIAVIENEFGEVGVDNQLVISTEEEIFEMNNGCICCTVRGDLIRILGNLMKRRDKFDKILIETTGLADPGPVIQTFFMDDEMKDKLRVDGVVTLVDSGHVHLHLDDAGGECKEQIAFADVIVLNKTDLLPSADLDALETRLRSINRLARVHRAVNADLPVSAVLGIGGFDLQRALSLDPAFLEEDQPFAWGGVLDLPAEPLDLVLGGHDDHDHQHCDHDHGHCNHDHGHEHHDHGHDHHHHGHGDSLDLVLLPVPGLSMDALRSVQKQAAALFSGDAKTHLHPGDALPSGLLLHNLCLGHGHDDHHAKKFTFHPGAAGPHALFTRPAPQEAGLMLLLPDGNALHAAVSREYAPPHSHDEEVSSVGIVEERPVNTQKMNAWLARLLREKGADIFRMKGVINVHGAPNRFVFQGVHMLFDGKVDRPWKPGEPRSTTLVFIGRHLDREELLSDFRACLA